MAGAYMAKVAAAAADPGYPPGWPSYPWPFPGPYPPGYTPTLTLVMTAPSTLRYGGAASITGSARDQGTYATNEPSAITWTAQDQDGSVVNLRFSGDTSYSTSISSAVSFGTYWGATPSIEFELTADNEDDVVTLAGYYTLDEIQVVQSKDIVITAPAVPTDSYLVVTMNWSVPVGIQVVTLQITSGVRKALVRHTTVDGGSYYSTADLSPTDTVVIGETKPMSIALGTQGNPMQRSQYGISLKNNIDSDNSATLTGVCSIYNQDGELYDTFNVDVALDPFQPLTWLTIDTSPYSVTENQTP